ncbi:hypothetical protein JYT97_02060 [Haliea sp. AH-315-K21]|uniref:Uncharacterized protein n=1 Tax=SAR86 cluster bacterium TaxID=2030880 RepID=A0A2A5CAD1_9GAMM|nr:hypothetical protein [Haliea sp. AH-315-K21]PCJ40448.1 MAG: hypothetical protein COA71_11375 [SAR86 cluster bacterium]
MNLELIKFDNLEDIVAYNKNWDICFIGKALDDRTKATISYSKQQARTNHVVLYDPYKLSLTIDKNEVFCHELKGFLEKYQNSTVLIDGTSLGVPEIGLLLSNLKNLENITISILYAEPGGYTANDDESDGSADSKINNRDFNLTKQLIGYQGIPQLADTLDIETPNYVVFFLGFEGYRLSLALEELNIITKECSLVFGVPSFQPSWELNAFANNIKSINENDLQGRVYFCGADNPAAVLKQLQELRSDIGDDQKITIVPIGTKPHSIGSLIFTAWDDHSYVLYDHPIKANERSKKIGSLHLYSIL